MMNKLTKEYISLGDIPQNVLDGCKDEFGMRILHLPELRSPYGTVYSAQRDLLVATYSTDRYCSECEEYVDSVTEIGLLWVTKDPNESECGWDEIGDEICPECQSCFLTDSPEEAAEISRQDYLSDMGDAIRKGEW